MRTRFVEGQCLSASTGRAARLTIGAGPQHDRCRTLPQQANALQGAGRRADRFVEKEIAPAPYSSLLQYAPARRSRTPASPSRSRSRRPTKGEPVAAERLQREPAGVMESSRKTRHEARALRARARAA